MRRVCIDANIIISYLLLPDADRPSNHIIHACFAYRITLVLNEQIFHEVQHAVATKPWLSQRIAPVRASRFLGRLHQLAIMEPEMAEPVPSATRDPGDDYLVAHALRTNIDYLVTGDKDLLVLGTVGSAHIVTPAEFLALLEMEPDGD